MGSAARIDPRTVGLAERDGIYGMLSERPVAA
jgi:hypothetical protein